MNIPKTKWLVLANSMASLVFIDWHELKYAGGVWVISHCELKRLKFFHQRLHRQLISGSRLHF